VCRAVLAADEPAAMAGTFGGPAQRHDVLAWSLLADLDANFTDTVRTYSARDVQSAS